MSTFAELIKKPSSQKVVLVEIDIEETAAFWSNLRPFVWYVNWLNVYSRVDSSLYDVDTTEYIDIGTVRVDDILLTKQDTLAGCVGDPGSFFSEVDTRTLYIYTPRGTAPNLHAVKVGVTWGVANHAQDYRERHYEPRVKSIPKIKRARDRLFFGKTKFQGGMIQLDNTDGEFDEWAEDNDVFGNEARMFVGFAELAYTDYARIFTGYVEKVTVSETRLQLNLMEKRKLFSQPVPSGVITESAYSSIDDRYIGQSLPWVFGTVLDVPGIPIDGVTSAATYTFLLADPGYGRELNEITTVYADGVEVTPSATDLEACTVTLGAADYNPHGSVGTKLITADVKGFEDGDGDSITDPREQMKELLSHVASYEYSTNYYDTTEWAAAGTIGDTGLYIGQETKLVNALEVLASSMLAWFYIQADGLLGLRRYDDDRAVDHFINREDMLRTPVIRYDPTEIYTSIKVGTRQRPGLGIYEYTLDDSREDAAFDIFKTKLQKTVDTKLSSPDDAEDFADAFLDIGGSIDKRVTLMPYFGHVEVEVGDFLYAACFRRDGTGLLGWCLVDVLSVDIDPNNFTVKIDGRLIRRAGQPGIWVTATDGAGGSEWVSDTDTTADGAWV